MLWLQLKIKGRDIASTETFKKKYDDYIRMYPNGAEIVSPDMNAPADFKIPDTPLFYPAILPTAMYFGSEYSVFLGLRPGQESDYDIIEKSIKLTKHEYRDGEQASPQYKFDQESITDEFAHKFLSGIKSNWDDFKRIAYTSTFCGEILDDL